MDSYTAHYRRDSDEWQAAAAAAGFIAAFLAGALGWTAAAGIAALAHRSLAEPVRIMVLVLLAVPAWAVVAAWLLRNRRCQADPRGVVFSVDKTATDRQLRDPLRRGPHREWKQGYRREELDQIRRLATRYAPDVIVRGG